MLSPFPGMDPFVEENPIFHEIHTAMLAAAIGLLQPQLRPKYIARLDHPSADELQLRKQRRIVIYVRARPRMAVASIELLSPSNKEKGSTGQRRYLEKRASALGGGLHWIEIDLLRSGQRPPMPVSPPEGTDYLAYVAQAVEVGWKHLLYPWKLPDPFPMLPIPLLGNDQVRLDLGACFREAYDRLGADDEADYTSDPSPPLSKDNAAWVDALLRAKGLRPAQS